MEDIVENLKDLSCEEKQSPLWDMVMNCMLQKDEINKLKFLRKVAQHLKKNQRIDTPPDEAVYVKTFTNMFKAVEPKSALCRTIKSILQSFPNTLQESVIEGMCTSLKEELSYQTGLPAPTLRRRFEYVAAHLENFPVGELVVEASVIHVLTFLQDGLYQTVQNTRNSANLVEKTIWMGHSLAGLKTIITVVQKSSKIIDEQIKDVTCSTAVEDIISEALEILNDECFSLECRSASGLTLSLLSKVLFGEEISLKKLVRAVLSIHQDAGDSSCDRSHLCKAFLLETPLSHLFLLHGLLAMYSPQALLQIMTIRESQEVILTNIVFWELVKLSSVITDASQSLCVARSLVQWTIVARNCVVLSDDLKTALCGTEEIPKAVLDYIWQNWDHPVDGIRHQCRSIFQNLIETHVKCQPDGIKEDLFLTDLFHTLVKSSRQVRGKYGLLVSLVGYIQISDVLRMHPSIAADLMMAMNEQSMAPFVSDLLEKLFNQHLHQCQDNIEEWCTTWISPALKIQLDSRDLPQQNKYLTQYFVPKILKCNPPCLSFVTKSLDTGKPSILHSSKQLSVLVTWLKVSRSLGILSNNSNKETAEGDFASHHLWRGIVSLRALQQALCHRNSQVSLSALGLLCESNKTSEALTVHELALLRQSLPLHMANQSAAFRQQLVALIKKLLFRLRESSMSFEKRLAKAKLKKDKVEEDTLVTRLSSYKDFLNWLWMQLMKGLSPGSSYPRRATSLFILSVIKSLFKDVNCKHFDYNGQWNSKNCSLLLHRLTDTFDANKVVAFDLLRDLSQATIGWQDKTALYKMYDCALQLSSSNKPHHCETAAYLLRLLARQKNPAVKTGCGFEDNVRGIVTDLCQVLKQQIIIGQSSLCEAAASGAMYGILHCIRATLSDVCLQEVGDYTEWIDVLHQVMSLSLEVASVAAPIVCNSSPEGYIPDLNNVSSHQDPSLVSSSPSQTAAPLEIFHVTPQMVLVCCWRSMKEVSLTLGHLALTLPLEGEEQGAFILSIKQIEDMGNFFLKLLQESKHRGAFELAYAGFEKLCTKLWRSTNSSLLSLPRKWLHHLMSEVTEGVESLCATRRSAGVPFSIQAIVGSEPDSFGKKNFKETMTKLIKLVSCETNSGDVIKKQVHALNILRAMYRDTRLGEEVFQFIADGVKAAVTGFGSHLWAVRNSSTLLFSALVTRIFGVNREKDELSKKNCMTGRELFSRFPTLHSFLMDQLNKSLESNQNGSLLHPSLFPTLILLSHLHPSYQEDDTTLHSTRKMIPLVIRCCNCAVYKTRCMAARALQSLVSLNDVIPTLVSLAQSLPLTIEDGMCQNKVHGVLLMISSLLEGHVKKTEVATNTVERFFSDVVPILKSRLWIASSLNKCATTRAAFLNLLNQTVLDEVWIHSISLSPEMQETLSSFQVCASNVIISELIHQFAYSQPDCVTLATEQATAVTMIILLLHDSCREDCDFNSSDEKSQNKILIRFSDEITASRSDLVMNLLNTPFYEVRNIALRFINTIHSWEQPLGFLNERRNSDFTEPDWVLNHTSMNNPELSKLVAMVIEGEPNMECLEQILQALNHSYPIQDVVKILEETYNISSIEYFNLLLKLSSSYKAGDGVCGPLIELTGRLLTLVENQTDTNSFNGMLTEWINLVEELCNEDASSVFNLQVCRSLNNVIFIKELNKKFGNQVVRLWNILLFLLLQGDDVTIQMAVGILLRVSKVTTDNLKKDGDEELYFRDMHSNLAIKLAVKVFIELVLDNSPSLCLSSLCSWACGDMPLKEKDSLADYGEEASSNKIFEKGEVQSSLASTSLIDAALLGIVSIGDKMKFSKLSYNSSEEIPRDLQQENEISNINIAETYQLRVTLSDKSLDILKTAAHELFQNMCSQLSAFLHAEPHYETTSKFLRARQFEDSWTHFSRYLACLTSLSSCSFCLSSRPQHLHNEMEILKIRGCNIFVGHFA
ncbi:Thyroid adenoma-associated protein-like [Holothuria leucospilota]|uniref:tRNA (32-2'-O)-methyltransferase regulator THADA n=1 Tax=Holothuria leucospilota TaxID=206669 RepID=A0A9Q1CG86_HOLLE|nr:Thyroid adenoma-associated protein-like [Holothuria leucospilota]